MESPIETEIILGLMICGSVINRDLMKNTGV